MDVNIVDSEMNEIPEQQQSTSTSMSNVVTRIQVSSHDHETPIASSKNESLDEELYISNYLSSHPLFAKEWFTKNANQEIIQEWVNLHNGRRTPLSCESWSLKSYNEQASEGVDDELLTASYAEITKGGRNSVTSELFNDIVAGSARRKKSTISQGEQLTRHQLKDRLHKLDEHELFMQLIRDISNELNIDILCHKILVNVSLLTNSDRGSLFLAKGSRDDRYLAPKLFDVTPDSLLHEALLAAEQYNKIPFGSGIAGHVALTKETVNIKDAYQDSRFNKEIDCRTGYHTKSIMCMPILNFGGDVIGVAQCINKIADDGNTTNKVRFFSKQDEQVFKKYLTFCGIGIQNAQLFEMSVSEYKRNQLLLSLARSIFEETTSLDALINKIMVKAQGLLQSEKCRVYLVDTERQELEETYNEKLLSPVASNPRKFSKPEDVIFTSIFELPTGNSEIIKLCLINLHNDQHVEYARQVAASGQTFNCSELTCASKRTSNPETSSELEKVNESSERCIDRVLSVPILNSDGKVIGVAQLIHINKGDPFSYSEVDVATLEAFSIFCGLGIHNTLMYEKAVKLTAKQKVALEVLSYHASSSIEETKKFMSLTVPAAEKFNLHSFQFSDFNLDERDTCLAAIRMFLDLEFVNKFKIPYEILCRWVLSVKKNYRPVIYHNWRHALNVTQTMFAMLTIGQMGQIMSDIEQLALIVASMCHDLDHRGTNNSFQAKSGSPLATLYSTSIMENHHFNHCVLILNSEGNNILQSLSTEEYRNVMQIIESAILSTDLAQYFKKKDRFGELVASGEREWKDREKKDLVRGMMMTACDVSAICKPWDTQKKIAELVASEFFEQGDLEKEELKEIPIAMMDREKKDQLPMMQVGFIDLICLPVYKILSECWPSLKPLYDGCLENRMRWFRFAGCSSSSALSELDPSLKELLIGCELNRTIWARLEHEQQFQKENLFSKEPNMPNTSSCSTSIPQRTEKRSLGHFVSSLFAHVSIGCGRSTSDESILRRNDRKQSHHKSDTYSKAANKSPKSHKSKNKTSRLCILL